MAGLDASIRVVVPSATASATRTAIDMAELAESGKAVVQCAGIMQWSVLRVMISPTFSRLQGGEHFPIVRPQCHGALSLPALLYR